MFFFKKIRPFLRCVSYIFIFLNFNSDLYQCVHCALIVKPENVAAMNGEAVSLSCASDSEESVAWVAYSPGSPEREYIFSGRVLSPSFSSYISFSQEQRGHCSLQINVTRKAAKRYFCVEQGSATDASADLIVFERSPECFSKLTDTSVNITCSVKFAGNWAPIMEWKTHQNQKLEVELFSSHSDLVTSHLFLPLNLTRNDTAYKINVITKFSDSGRPQQTSAINIPEYNHTISPYVSEHSGICHADHAVIVLSVVVVILIIGLAVLIFIVLKRQSLSRHSENGNNTKDSLSTNQPAYKSSSRNCCAPPPPLELT